jgi:dihydrofolate reductase
MSLGGGANVARQVLAAGLVDEMLPSRAPTLPGRGERLFDGDDDMRGLAFARTVATPVVTRLTFARR